jgi:class 3 adenylate cyclase
MILTARMNSALERKYLLDKEEAYIKEIEAEKERSDHLLLNILPESIAGRMKEDQSVIAEAFDNCSILFADITGFTNLASSLDPTELVSFLNDLFSKFDDLCDELGVEKIKTIGDNYMAASGVPVPSSIHAVQCVRLGLKMLETVASLDEINGQKVQMRVGIHSGPVVAGVIGKRKFVFDLWGDTVNVAQRMESHGVPGALQVSSSTFSLIQDLFSVRGAEERDIKGKGRMMTYLIGEQFC